MTWTLTQQESLLMLIHRRGERLALAQQLASLQKTLDGQRTQQETLFDRWDEEQADVNRLERLSWATIYYHLVSRHDEQLTKEKEEAQRARLDYDALSTTVTDLTHQVGELQNRLAAYADVETAYAQLMHDKEQMVQGRRDETYEQHVAQLTAAEQHLTELTEARLAGRAVIEAIDPLLRALKEAYSLGQWDAYANSALASAMKYSRLDEVRDWAGQVRSSVRRFSLELADIHQQLQEEWTFDDGLTRFVDVFFDNIFTDMAVQRRIEKAQHNVNMLRMHVKEALRTVISKQEQAAAEKEQRSYALRTYLEQAV